MNKYRLISTSVVAKIDNDGISRSSCSVENGEYLEWLAEGNTPDPADPVVPEVPSVVTMRQARLALHKAGLLTVVNTAVAAADEETKIAWEFSTEVQRDFPLVQTLATALNLSEQDLDNLFITASQL